MAKKILVVLSEYGYWGEELIGPLEALDKAGYETVFMTPTGKRAEALPPSMDHTYIDPPLGRPVVAKEMADKVKAMEKSKRLDGPLSLKSLISPAKNVLDDLVKNVRGIPQIRQSILICGAVGGGIGLVGAAVAGGGRRRRR